MRYALKSFTPNPISLRYKADTIFHELLHIFLFAHPIENSDLLRQHAEENVRVKNHLHLLALQKAVLMKVGQSAQLKELISNDSALPGGYYKRAWDIVNVSEDAYLNYLNEVAK